MPSIRHKRGTRAQIDAAAAQGLLRPGEVYLVTDEARLTVAVSAGEHRRVARTDEAGGSDPWSWAALSADIANAAGTLLAVPDLSFSAAAGERYLVEINGSFLSSATSSGLALALEIPSGAICGMSIHPVTASALGVSEQNQGATTTGASVGVRAVSSPVPLFARHVILTGATGGPVRVLFRPEVAGATATIRGGATWLSWRTIPA